MRETARKFEAKYYPDLDKDLGSDKDKDLGSDKDKDVDSEKDKDLGSDKDKDSDLDSNRESSSSDDFVYVQKPKTNKLKCEECNEELALKHYNRHIESLKHKKNARLYNRIKIIEEAKDEGIKVTIKDIEQKLEEQYPEEGIKFCDSCDMYLDNNTAFNNHVTTLKHRNNVRLVNGEIVKNGSKFDSVICKTSLSQHSVDQHLKTKMHLDNVKGKDKDRDSQSGYTNLQSSFTDKDITKDASNFCNICNTRYNKKNEHNESEE